MCIKIIKVYSCCGTRQSDRIECCPSWQTCQLRNYELRDVADPGECFKCQMQKIKDESARKREKEKQETREVLSKEYTEQLNKQEEQEKEREKKKKKEREWNFKAQEWDNGERYNCW
jgi:hypothetical protein